MRRLVGIALSFACLSTPVWAASLPLRPGGYVETGTRCSDGSDANSLDYLHGVIETGGMTTRGQHVVSQRGNTFVLAAKVMDNQAGTSELDIETVTIHSPMAFRLKTKYGSADYRWCHEGSAL